jgi:hypothetical protein
LKNTNKIIYGAALNTLIRNKCNISTAVLHKDELTSNFCCCNEIPVGLLLLFGSLTNISGVNEHPGFGWLQLTLASTLHFEK